MACNWLQRYIYFDLNIILDIHFTSGCNCYAIKLEKHIENKKYEKLLECFSKVAVNPNFHLWNKMLRLQQAPRNYTVLISVVGTLPNIVDEVFVEEKVNVF